MAPPPPPPPLPPDVLTVLLSPLCARDLAAAARVCTSWRAAASPCIDDVAVRDVVRDLVLVVCSSMMDYEPTQGEPGTCIGCGAADAAFGQCLSCGAPVEPDDGSWHYAFGWVEGARPGM